MIAKEKVINNASELAREFNNLLKLIHEDLDALHKKVDIIEKQIIYRWNNNCNICS